jgi:hypothetical protein
MQHVQPVETFTGAPSAALPRTRQARLAYDNGTAVTSCVVGDITGTGARLKVEGALRLPGRVTLLLEGGTDRPGRAATVLWRSFDELGVAFD